MAGLESIVKFVEYRRDLNVNIFNEFELDFSQMVSVFQGPHFSCNRNYASNPQGVFRVQLIQEKPHHFQDLVLALLDSLRSFEFTVILEEKERGGYK